MFKKNKYVVIKQAISKDLAGFVANYFLMKKQVYDTCRQTRFISPYEILLGDLNQRMVRSHIPIQAIRISLWKL